MPATVQLDDYTRLLLEVRGKSMHKIRSLAVFV